VLKAKIILACAAAAIFLCLGVLDLIEHEPRVGIASLCLALANGLLLLPW
jgi:uncharacterized membrane protein (DUF2068 family)